MTKSIAALAATALLAGCATLNSVDSDVSSYTRWPAGRAPGAYVFERLPSQQAAAERQAQLEAAARDALADAGFREAAGAEQADVSVQVGARVDRHERTPYGDPFWHPFYGWGGGWGWGPRSRIGLGLHYAPPVYEREVAVLIRDRKTGQPLYESRASSADYGAGGDAVLAAMFDAAMRDFPEPAVSPRRVRVPLAN